MLFIQPEPERHEKEECEKILASRRAKIVKIYQGALIFQPSFLNVGGSAMDWYLNEKPILYRKFWEPATVSFCCERRLMGRPEHQVMSAYIRLTLLPTASAKISMSENCNLCSPTQKTCCCNCTKYSTVLTEDRMNTTHLLNANYKTMDVFPCLHNYTPLWL